MTPKPQHAPEVEVVRETFGRDEDVPNNPALPVLILSGAMPGSATPEEVIALFESNGWGGTWRYTVFDYHHFHPNAHEALGVAAGWADLRLGGPSGRTFRVQAGDVLVLPAGTGHCRLDASPDFTVCGAYPPGQEDYETIRAGERVDEDVIRRIAAVPLPETDPVYGKRGPLVDAWTKDAPEGP